MTRYAVERTTLAGGAPWVEVASITATDSVFYTAAAPTPADSVPFRFRITAVGSSPAEFWRSAEDTALSLPNPQFNVTFRVNMKQQMRVGELFPSAGHVVTVRGEFNDWLTSSNPDTLRDPDGDSIYVKSVRIPGGRSYQYNHWLNGQQGERFESMNARMLALAMADTILPVVFFEDDPPPTPVLFQVNMSVKMREGTFRPDFGDVVRVRGNFEDWDTSPPLSDPDADSVYTGTLGIRGPLTIQYKFFKTLRGGLDWESSIPNRTFQVPVETPSVIPVSYFDNDSGATGPPPLAWSAGLSSDTTVALSWQANQIPGHLYYAVYRDAQATRENPPILIATTPNTTVTDPDPPAGPVVYWVTSNSIFNSLQITAPTLVNIAAASQYTQSAGWNLVSVPVAAPFMSVSQLFPGLVSQAFAYQGSYQPVDPLSVGPGYWVKRAGAQTVAIGGAGVPAASVAVQSGWNLVGSIGLPVDAASVSSIPPGLVVSQFFSYTSQSGYAPADTIRPWRGYWVKATNSGQLVIGSTPSPEGRVRIVPITELPPPPPGEERTERAAEVPAEFALEQNYPNPFNPVTTITFAIPHQADRGDLLGRPVATLVDDTRAPGVYSVPFDASSLASGTYLYRLTAGAFTATRRMVVVK